MGFSWDYHGISRVIFKLSLDFRWISMEFLWELDKLLMEFEKGSVGFGCN